MNDVFSDLLDVCVVVYLDDILIYSDNIMLKGCKRELDTGTNKTMLCQLPIAY